METQNPNQLKTAMNYGALAGLAIILFYVLFYIFNLDQHSNTLNYVGYVIIIAGVVLGTKNYRDKSLSGFISYGHALGTGTLIALFASILTAFYIYVFFLYIDPSAAKEIMDKAEEQMIEQGKSDEEIEMAMTYMKKFMTPLTMSLMVVLMYTFMGFLFSLATSFFLKKNNPDSYRDENMNV